MSNPIELRQDVTSVATRWLIGFVGSLAIIFVLPRLIKAAARHYAFRLIAEIIAIVSFGLIAEKVVDWTTELERRSSLSDGNR